MRALQSVRILSIVWLVLILPVTAFAQADPLVGIRIEPEAQVDFDRSRDYGGWARMNQPYNRCFNVRDQVLSDESRQQDFKWEDPVADKWRCKVTSGSWMDKYSGKRIRDPALIDVDHVVPLKEAHESGGYKWPKEKRREYANFLRDPNHLIAVSYSENRRKGDRDPPNYMPPNAGYRCQYLRQWISVKRRWDLSMDATEAAFIRTELSTC